LAEAFFERGIGVECAPVDWHDFHLAKTTLVFRETVRSIKTALDPNSILAPGRYGIT